MALTCNKQNNRERRLSLWCPFSKIKNSSKNIQMQATIEECWTSRVSELERTSDTLEEREAVSHKGTLHLNNREIDTQFVLLTQQLIGGTSFSNYFPDTIKVNE